MQASLEEDRSQNPERSVSPTMNALGVASTLLTGHSKPSGANAEWPKWKTYIRRQEIIQKSRLFKKVNVNGGRPRMQDFFTEVVLMVTQASPVRNSSGPLFLTG
jgi:hypothetical protein